MKKGKVLIGFFLLVMVIASTSALFAGNGNGPNSGSGGNSNNNGGGNDVWIYHQHGNGTWKIMQVPAGAVSGHAAHGDVWYQTGCPLTGEEDACL